MKFSGDTMIVDAATRPTKRSEAASLTRGLAILELLATRPEGATLRELGEQLRLPGASVLRIARTLVELGYLSREAGSKRYFLTNRFLRMGRPAGRQQSLTECALPAMRDIRNATGETTQLGCLIDLEMVIIEQLASTHPFKYTADLGARCPSYSCAPGKAILAFLEESERETLVEQLRLKRFTNTTITSKRKFREELASIRACGYAVDRSEGLEGIHCVSAPILDHHGLAVAAITIAGPASRIPESSFPAIGKVIHEASIQASDRFNAG